MHGKEHTGMGTRTYVSETWEIDWLQSLNHFFIYTCSQSNSDGSVLKQSHQSKTGHKYMI